MPSKRILGVDIGGSGIKGAIVDIVTGKLLSERLRIPTPSPATPKAVAKVLVQLTEEMDWEKTIGCGFPAVVKNGTISTASNVDKKWIGTDAEELFSKACGSNVFVSNDADLAGLAEMRYGLGKGVPGSVLFLTIGTGIGSALFNDGQLVPNTEFGHIFLKNQKVIAEKFAADSVRKKEDLSWKNWGDRFNEYLLHMEKIIQPKLIILGGGGSKKFDQFSDRLTVKTNVLPAELLNNAGIIGAAVFGYEKKSSMQASKTFQ